MRRFSSIVKRILRPLIVWYREVIAPPLAKQRVVANTVNDSTNEYAASGATASGNNLASDDEITVTQVIDQRDDDKPEAEPEQNVTPAAPEVVSENISLKDEAEDHQKIMFADEDAAGVTVRDTDMTDHNVDMRSADDDDEVDSEHADVSISSSDTDTDHPHMDALESSNKQTSANGDGAEETQLHPPESEPSESGELPQPLRLLKIDDQPVTLLALVESLLFVAETAVEPKQFAEVLNVPIEDVNAALETLAENYVERASGLRLQDRNGKYTLVSMPLAAQPIEDFLNLDLNSRLSSAALETLAIVAYRQPVTRIQVESVRGVDCGGVIRTLLQRDLIAEVGRLDAVGRPILYGVTDLFMQHFGLTTMDELPALETTDADLLWAATQLADDDDDDDDSTEESDTVSAEGTPDLVGVENSDGEAHSDSEADINE